MADSKCGAVMESVMLVAPVTALEFLGEDYLLAGVGPNLSVYSLHAPPAVCATLTALRNQRIHGIRPDPWQQGRAARAAVAEEEEEEELEASLRQRKQGRSVALSEEEEEPSPWRQSGGVRSAVLAVFGGKAVRLVGFEEAGVGGSPCLRALGPLRELQDWVCDVRWLRGGAPLLAVALAHNAVLLLEAGRGRSLALRSCREGCLLYSALLLGQRWDHVVVVGGTVFNQLVLWRPGGGGAGGGTAERGAPVEARLAGHGGVIFGLAYERRLGWLASASDDRSVRLWGVGRLGGAAGCGDDPAPPCLRVLYGHQARVFSVRLLSPGRVYSAGEDGACLQWDGHSGRVQRTLRGHRAGGVRALALSGEGGAGRRGWVATGGADGGVRLWRVGEGEGESEGEGVPETQALEDLGFDGRGSPKVVRVVGSGGWREGGVVVVSTDQGEVYLREGGGWRPVWEGGPEYRSYSVMEVLDVGGAGGGAWAGLCAVGSLSGAVCVFPLSQPSAQVHLRAGEGKVHSVLWAGLGGGRAYLLASGVAGQVRRWRLEVGSDGRGLAVSAEPLPSFLLPPCAKRWLTAAAFLPRPQGALWFCGDRRGSLLLYRDRGEGEGDERDGEGDEREGEGDEREGEGDEREGEGDEREEERQGGDGEAGDGEAVQPVWTLFGAHGKQGVTWVCEHQGALFSCGRDGCVRVLRVGRGGERLELLRVERACRGMEWVERVLFLDPEAGTKEEAEQAGGRMAVLGFHSVSFVVWDVARRERLLSVPCGGGHRSWSYAPASGLVFVKQGAVTAALDPRGAGGGGGWGLRPGLHGRGAGCVCRLGRAGPWEVLASGGEDTTLSVLAARPVDGELAVLSVVTDHISSVRALAAVPRGGGGGGGGADGQTAAAAAASLSALLISAGGRAQLQCYRLLIGWGPGPGPPTCQVIQVAGHRLDEQWERRRNRHKTVKMDPETRYMSLAVLHDGTAGVLLAVACSDGAVRVFSVSEVDRKFQLLWESFYHQRCVLSLAPCWMEDRLDNRRLFVFSGATDGSVALWDMSALTAWRASSTAGLMWNGPGSPCFTVTVHQSGVNSLVVWEGHGEEADHEEEEAEPGEKEAAWMTVASGGDDGQLSVVNIQLQFPRPQVEGGAVSVQLQSRSSVPLAHAAPVTALQRLGPGLLVSTSPDQRVCLWQLTSPAPHQQDPAPHPHGPAPHPHSPGPHQQGSVPHEQGPAPHRAGPTLRHQGTLFSHVADAAGVAAWPGVGPGGGAWAAVCGQGLQLLRIRGEERERANE
ncbi:WD repeat-containing protein 6 [Anguilla anguilla]|uniref:WD repeat-containing protein 6 n=1 Tax=Anguilla anguilla TaxID=7936 RepID=UPI0015B1495E|nr:WD repeat-containing protein 6 [Anguilla anguilla]XP_035236574.1 WD repeat-containing protein 6 [Anguilla anguilla]